MRELPRFTPERLLWELKNGNPNRPLTVDGSRKRGRYRRGIACWPKQVLEIRFAELCGFDHRTYTALDVLETLPQRLFRLCGGTNLCECEPPDPKSCGPRARVFVASHMLPEKFDGPYDGQFWDWVTLASGADYDQQYDSPEELAADLRTWLKGGKP